ncbi:MAG TPA: TIGR00730 family Rossman fold protein [Mycobacteriales bacterium]|nr:TIGR00730 family Rossman fold protein [Mycobacteriales bacterium]
MATICVFCASSERIDQRYVDLAAEVGAELAHRGHTLVSGGGSVSCMGSVARAARAGGAHTIGVIPEALLAYEVADEDAAELLVTADMRARKGEMDRRADAFLTLPGGLGTLEELLEVWVSRTLRMHDKPVVVLDPDGMFAPLREQVEQLIAAGFARPSVNDAIRWATGVPEAFDLLEQPPMVQPPAADEVLEAEP